MGSARAGMRSNRMPRQIRRPCSGLRSTGAALPTQGCGPRSRVAAQGKACFLAFPVELEDPSRGATGADLQVQPSRVGQATSLFVRGASGVLAVWICQHRGTAFNGFCPSQSGSGLLVPRNVPRSCSSCQCMPLYTTARQAIDLPMKKGARCIFLAPFGISSGAGDGNRTHVICLGSKSPTIERHPRWPAL